MRIERFSFGSIRIDGVTYKHDVVIDHGEIRKCGKKPSKNFREQFGHTPLSVEEDVPWKCRWLVVGTGKYGALPVMDELKRKQERKKVELCVMPTAEVIKVLATSAASTNAVLHVTCESPHFVLVHFDRNCPRNGVRLSRLLTKGFD